MNFFGKEAWRRNALVGAAMLLAVGVMGVPKASADVFSLNEIFCNCLPTGSTAGTVTVTKIDANTADILVQLNAGLSFHDSGLNSFVFNGPAGLTSGNVSIVNNGGSTWTFMTGNANADGAGNFLYWWDCTAVPNGCSGLPTTFEFRVSSTGVGNNLALLETTNGGASHTDFAANVAVQGVSGCTGMVGGGNGTQQSAPSGGSAVGSACTPTQPPPVPEPASLVLLGTGLATAGYRLRGKQRTEDKNASK